MLNLPNGHDAPCSQLNTTHLCDEKGSHGFVEGRAVHVDGCSNGHHEAANTLVHAVFLLQTGQSNR